MKYELWLGKFEGDYFKWPVVKTFDTLPEGIKSFKEFTNELLNMDDIKLYNKYKSTRLDIVLKDKSKRYNWVGIYNYIEPQD